MCQFYQFLGARGRIVVCDCCAHEMLKGMVADGLEVRKTTGGDVSREQLQPACRSTYPLRGDSMVDLSPLERRLQVAGIRDNSCQ